MRSIVHLNHYPDLTSPERQAVTAGLSPSIADLAVDTTRIGSVLGDTLDYLGVERHQTAPHDMLMIGSQTELERRQRNLCVNIGRLVDKAMQIKPLIPRLHWQTQTEDTMLRIAHTDFGDSTEPQFIASIGEIFKVFAEDYMGGECRVRYGGSRCADKVYDTFRRDLKEIDDVTIDRYLHLLPEAHTASLRDAPLPGKLLLWRGYRWLVSHKDELDVATGSSLAEGFSSDMALNREAIRLVYQNLQQRGMPEIIYLPIETWEQQIEEKLAEIRGETDGSVSAIVE